MKNRFVHLLHATLRKLIPSLILIYNLPLLGQESGRIIGTILDNHGNPMVAAEISIPSLEIGTTTRANGEFEIKSVPKGDYTVRIDYLGFQTRQISAVRVRSGETTQMVDVRMSPKLLAMNETIVTANRRPKSLTDISSGANLVNAEIIQQRNAKTSAEALREETGIFIQKTNHGGGSAIIRGLSSNRIVILVDGIRLNNSTYRLGNHQYLTTVDYQMLSKIEVVRGPTSALYGSDALGGAINLVTEDPRTKSADGWTGGYRGNGRYASADGEKTGRAQAWAANGRLAVAAGFSYKNFGDLRRGGNSNNPLLENSTDGLRQSPSGFSAYDADAKLVYHLDEQQNVMLAWQFAEQIEVPRYDKYESGSSILWQYTPQKRQLAYARYRSDHDLGFVRNLQATASFNRQQEGRLTQDDASSNIERERDDVKTYGLNLQMGSVWGAQVLSYGLDIYQDQVASAAFVRAADGDVETQTLRGRFPDDATYRSMGVFVQDEVYLNQRLIVNGGLRYSRFDTEFTLPFDPEAAANLGDVDLSFGAFTGSVGLLYKASENITVMTNAAQAFRAPNLSDLSKLGESKGSTFEVPNTELDPERMTSLDFGIRYNGESFSGELVGYVAQISDLLASVDATFRGSDVIVSGGDTLKVKHKANTGEGFIRGFESRVQVRFDKAWSVYGNLSFSYGQNTTLDEPIGKMPPLFGVAGIRWQQADWSAESYLRFAGKQDRLSADDLDDDRIPPGGTPAWQTWNIRGDYRLGDQLRISAGIENVLDLNYREHGSGINGSGRNFIIGLALTN